MNRLLRPALAAFLIPLSLSFGATARAAEGFEGWSLEPGLGQAHLVMVARVSRISRMTVVEGAKTDIALREYRFQPVRLLKGLFQRDELSMTAADLGLPAEDGSSVSPLHEGEFRLLILARQRGFGSFGCVSAAPGATTVAQRVPLLAGPEDPLVGVVQTLIRVADSRSRREQAELLIERLGDAEGVAAVPLLTSLRLRADWVAAEDRATSPLARLVRNPHTAVRGAALEVVRDMLLHQDRSGPAEPFAALAAALAAVLTSDEPVTEIRLAAWDALALLPELDADGPLPRETLATHMAAAATDAERAAAATALSRLDSDVASATLLEALSRLPLDTSATRETVYIRAASRTSPLEDARRHPRIATAAERVLRTRLERSLAARQPVAAEVQALGRTRSPDCLPLMLAAASRPELPADDRRHVAEALGRLGDDRGVPVLAGWLREGDPGLKPVALASLERLDSPAAAQAVRPLLKPEGNLSYKLRIARLLARHGFADGYALATEHLADDGHTAAATLVLVALDDPRTTGDLTTILATAPDRRWRAAALTGLAAIGHETARSELLEILADDRHPLTADAAQAAGLAADSRLLAPLAERVQSRNRRIALASLVALRRFLSGVRQAPQGLAAVDADPAGLLPAAEVPAPVRTALAASVASLARDAYVDAALRREALAVAALLDDPNYPDLLDKLADQAELQGAPLLATVQTERNRLRRSADGG